MSQRALAAAAHLSPGHLSDLINGRKTPSAGVAHALDRALHADGRLAAFVAYGLTDHDHDTLAAAATDPSRITPATVAAFQHALDAQRELDDTLGSAAMLRPVAAQLDTITHLVRYTAGRHRIDLMGVAGQWAQFAGWLHTSVGRWDDAGQWLGRALAWALDDRFQGVRDCERRRGCP
jgi:transcriptional regulator with XRE-family HTH domain